MAATNTDGKVPSRKAWMEEPWECFLGVEGSGLAVSRGPDDYTEPQTRTSSGFEPAAADVRAVETWLT